jgi:predicted HNH restriction endonuclease
METAPIRQPTVKTEITFGDFPDEIGDGPYIEGAAETVVVNKFERNQDARDACIGHYGITCQACGFDFEASYGSVGKGFIHVHHVVPLSEIGSSYSVDTIKDLRPVCPNCHAMIHRRSPPLSVEELSKLLRR